MHFVDKDPGQKRIDFNQKLKSNKILNHEAFYSYNTVVFLSI